ncbi:hypothetical protein BU25DRAFT_431786 [Macroventuria anomochaeta]|uniref:Uncharacterized protein n=1 Tax=Macroventuria anomochaeta TaxID=301207 RepID=A0ACB6RYX9_9PLEO|nr:uncharacterized protein BU25DRAFT_431786 [Macroventuria anomochaeta]KAF2627230.1 hypothetical protein BU25DRAFT_431786 [Macroventuria anomochaeta]
MSNSKKLNTSPSAACNRLFSITELVDMFLNRCSTHALLNCTMVCRNWKGIISRSKSLQEQLFLKHIEVKDSITGSIRCPLINHIDWWHEFMHDRSITGSVGSRIARRVCNRDGAAANGWGHRDQSRQNVTLGMLWDLVESRLARGCVVRVQYFVHGKAVEDHQLATAHEQLLIAQGDRIRRPYTPLTPRVKTTTQQFWSKKPWGEAGFDMEAQQWVTMPKK